MSEDRTVEVIELDAIMRQENGRKVLLRLLERSGYFDGCWNPDARAHAFAEGARDQGLRLYTDMLEANPAQLTKMIEEHNNGD